MYELANFANWRMLYNSFLCRPVENGAKQGELIYDKSAILKRFLLIFSDLIFDSRVERGMPSLAAAPEGPYTRPPLSLNAASIMAFS